MSNSFSDDIVKIASLVLSGGKQPQKEIAKEEVKKDHRVIKMENIKFYLDMSQSILDEKFGDGYSKNNPDALNKLTEISLNYEIESNKLKIESSRNSLIESFVKTYYNK